MGIKFLLAAILLMMINAVSAGWNFHLYLVDGSPVNMICGFTSVAVALLLLIAIGKKL